MGEGGMVKVGWVRVGWVRVGWGEGGMGEGGMRYKKQYLYWLKKHRYLKQPMRSRHLVALLSMFGSASKLTRSNTRGG